MSKAAKMMAVARTKLILDEPFFGALALRLKLVEDPECKTAWVDGTSLGYNPEFIESLTVEEVVALQAHEVMHCAAGHPWRRGSRPMKRWNNACDRAINPMLRDHGFRLPEGALLELDPSHKGKSSEWIHARLPEESEDGGEGDGEGEGPPDPLGEVRDAPQPGAGQGQGQSQQQGQGGQAVQTEADWKMAVSSAVNTAKGRSKGAGPGAKLIADNVLEPRVDWESALRRFVQQLTNADYTWSRPNPRFLASGLYMPTLRSEEAGTIAVAIDTSGSIDKVLLEQFAAELRSIFAEVKPNRVYVLYADHQVQRMDTFERGEDFVLNPVGGGGTIFGPVFDKLREVEDAEEVRALVYLTDLDGWFPGEQELPTLWASTDKHRTAPFGETIYVGG